MSDPLDNLRLPRKAPVPPPLWSMWGRETVKDLTLLLAAMPVLATVLMVPVIATSGGSWKRLIGLLALFVAIWWTLRVLLRRWVAAGDRAGDPPSPG